MTEETHGTLRHAADKAQDTIGGMVGRFKAQTLGSRSGDAFAKNAAIGDMYEIAAADVALSRAESETVRTVARKMIADHTTSTHQLRSAMRMSETSDLSPLPKEMDARRRKLVDHLESAPADAFDTAYLDQQILSHQETVDLMTGYAEDGDNWQLRSFAQGTAPVVQRHLRHIEQVREQLA